HSRECDWRRRARRSPAGARQGPAPEKTPAPPQATPHSRRRPTRASRASCSSPDDRRVPFVRIWIISGLRPNHEGTKKDEEHEESFVWFLYLRFFVSSWFRRGLTIRHAAAILAFAKALPEPVEGNLEHVEIAQLAGERNRGVCIVQRPREDQVDVAIRQPAMRTQPHSAKLGQVESRPALSPHRAAIAPDDKIPDPVCGPVERPCGGG